MALKPPLLTPSSYGVFKSSFSPLYTFVADVRTFVNEVVFVKVFDYKFLLGINKCLNKISCDKELFDIFKIDYVKALVNSSLKPNLVLMVQFLKLVLHVSRGPTPKNYHLHRLQKNSET